jgi:hypothetical protein
VLQGQLALSEVTFNVKVTAEAQAITVRIRLTHGKSPAVDPLFEICPGKMQSRSLVSQWCPIRRTNSHGGSMCAPLVGINRSSLAFYLAYRAFSMLRKPA